MPDSVAIFDALHRHGTVSEAMLYASTCSRSMAKTSGRAAEPKRGDVPPNALIDGCERMVLRLQPCEQALHLCGMPTSTIPWRRHPALVERVSAMPFRLVIPAA
jgi:hypothetical protein